MRERDIWVGLVTGSGGRCSCYSLLASFCSLYIFCGAWGGLGGFVDGSFFLLRGGKRKIKGEEMSVVVAFCVSKREKSYEFFLMHERERVVRV